MSDSLFDDLIEMHDDHYIPEPTDRNKIFRAPFTVAGGKNRSVKYILPHLPMRKVWVGTGVITLNRDSSDVEVFNDRYSAITAFYRCIRDPIKLAALITWLELTLHSREEFIHCRDTWIDETDDVVRAAKWFYAMRTSVLGKMDCFARGLKSFSPINIPKALEGFPAIHSRFRYIQIENLDFEQCFNDFDDHCTVHYFDPPYVETDSGIYNHVWTRTDLDRLLRCCQRAKGFVALSHYPDEQIDGESFWTDKHEWNVALTSEINSFDEKNNKAHLEHVQNIDHTVEKLWIKA